MTNTPSSVLSMTHAKMKPLWKKKWIAALLSGDYKQGREALRTGTEEKSQFCCLGVLCDLVAKGKRDGQWNSRLSKGETIPAWAFAGVSGNLPKHIQEKANVSLAAENHLMILNDTYEWSFKKIAKWIDNNL